MNQYQNNGFPDYQDPFHEAKALYKAKHYEQAVRMFTRFAKGEHAGALIFLGDCYYYGRGIEQDLGKATECYIKSGKFYFPAAGLGILPEYYAQTDWLRKAAKNGHLIAQYKMVQESQYSDVAKYLSSGSLGEIGNIPAPDNSSVSKYKEAFMWYQKAAEFGYTPAQYNLGWYYEHNDLLGLEKNLVKAAEWYEKAAEQGFVQAMADLSRCYVKGTGARQDIEKAKELKEKLSDKKYSKIQLKLHDMEIGDAISAGKKRNKRKAYILLTCQCDPNINCGIASDKRCYKDSFGNHIISKDRSCFNNSRKKTINDILLEKYMAEKLISRSWKYIQTVN